MAQHPALERIDHRPWGLPQGAWQWRQSWQDLLFCHWPVPVSSIRHLVPEPLTVQEFDGVSWVGLVPFRMAGVSHRFLPDVPGVSAFPELNVRLYVEYEGRPGVWFLSCDATSPVAIWAARTFFHLPYLAAKMTAFEDRGSFRFTSERKQENAVFRGVYRDTSRPYFAEAGSLAHWLTERYCLYAKAPNGNLYRTEVHHLPWSLQDAELSLEENSVVASHGIQVSGPPSLIHFSRRIDVVVWNGVRVA